eukprot:1071613-Rhodomonas_salina.2
MTIYTPKSDIRETSFSAQCVPGKRFLVFDFGVCCFSAVSRARHLGTEHAKARAHSTHGSTKGVLGVCAGAHTSARRMQAYARRMLGVC